MRTLLTLILLIPFTVYAGAKDKVYGWVVMDEITSIYDGDTFRANINTWPAIVGERVPALFGCLGLIRQNCGVSVRLKRN